MYELSFIIDPAIPEEALSEEVAKLTSIITSHGGSVIIADNPRLRNLAYTIEIARGGKRRKYTQGHFGWIKFNSGADKVEQIGVEVDKDSAVIRKLLIHGSIAPLPSPRRSISRTTTEPEAKISEAEIDKEVEKLIAETTPA